MSVIINSTDLGVKFRELWPNLKIYDSIRLADEDYYNPTKKRLKQVIAEAKKIINKIGNDYIPEIYDCDDFALLLNAIVKAIWVRFAKENKVPKEYWRALSFGEVWGTKFRDKKMAHAINVCLTRDKGIVLIEPQDYSLWVAGSQDAAFFIKL